MAEQNTALEVRPRANMLSRFAEKYDIDGGKVLALVGATVFKGGKDEPPLTPEEIVAALIVCNAYDLNPFTKEIYAFRSKGKLLIVVSVDGWAKIVNRQDQLNGIEFTMHFTQVIDGETGEVSDGPIRAVTCIIHRKDCALPVAVTEYTHECRRETIPWNTMPIRMTRNRAFVQCARIAFSVAGIIDDDEAQTIEGNPEFINRETKRLIDQSVSKTAAVKAAVHSKASAGKKQPSDAAPEPTQEQPEQTQETTQAVEPSAPPQPAKMGELFKLLSWGVKIQEKWLKANANLSSDEQIAKLEKLLETDDSAPASTEPEQTENPDAEPAEKPVIEGAKPGPVAVNKGKQDPWPKPAQVDNEWL